METLEQLRYPIGRFVYTPATNDADRRTARAAHIATIAALPTRLRKAAADLTPAQLDTPYREGGWSVRQVVHHLGDSHTNAQLRFRFALTTDAPTIMPYPEALWAELPDARIAPPEATITMLDGWHERWDTLLKNMTDADFERVYVHPEMNRAVTLEEATALYAWHSDHHLAHITNLRTRKGW